MIRRDRNHPSVFMWSIGNEVLEQWPDDHPVDAVNRANGFSFMKLSTTGRENENQP
jgi:beta-galactosidase/beta-glucuronidase